jgi:ubiquinone/menaquinone biosynthesis C-methylase UbiE
MLARARQKAAAAGLAAAFRQGDAEASDAPDAAYDLLAERCVIWTPPEPLAALRHWKRPLLWPAWQLRRGPSRQKSSP